MNKGPIFVSLSVLGLFVLGLFTLTPAVAVLRGCSKSPPYGSAVAPISIDIDPSVTWPDAPALDHPNVIEHEIGDGWILGMQADCGKNADRMMGLPVHDPEVWQRDYQNCMVQHLGEHWWPNK